MTTRAARSNEARLASLKQRQTEQRQRQKLISDALKVVDDAGANAKRKRIVFEDSDDDGDEEASPVAAKKAAPSDGKRTLFGDSDDDEEPGLAEMDPDELVPSRFKGKSSEKLTKLSLAFKGDKRFELTEAFADDRRDRAADDQDGVKESDEQEMAFEKEKQMRLLSVVMGHDVKSTSAPVGSKQAPVVNRPFHRFDPDNPDHIAWMRNQQKKPLDTNGVEVTKVAVTVEAPKTEKPAPPPDASRFFEVNADFMAELKARLGGGELPGSKVDDDNDDNSAAKTNGFDLKQENESEAGSEIADEEEEEAYFDADEDDESNESAEDEDNDDEEDDDQDADSDADQVDEVTTPAAARILLQTAGAPGFFVSSKEPHVAKNIQRFKRSRKADFVTNKWYAARTAAQKIARNLRRQSLRDALRSNGHHARRQ